MPGDKTPAIKPPRAGVDATPETPYVREPARPKKPSPDDYRRGPAKPEDNTPDKIELLSSRDGESDYVRGPAPVKKPSPDDYRREPAKVKPSTRDDIQLMSGLSKMPKAMQAAQATSKEYANYLRTREADRQADDKIKFDGAFSAISADGRLSSGADPVLFDALKPGDIIDTATPEGRAVIEQYYKQMGDSIIALLEDAVKNPGKFKWNMPWRGGEHIPRNPTKRNMAKKAWSYQGSNYVLLNTIAVNRGYKTNKWAGATQWKKLKGKPKANARPVGVLTPILGSQPRKYKYEFVYNVADIDGLKPEMYEPEIDLENMSPKARVKIAEAIVSELKPKLREGGVGGAFYSPSGDYINMPEFKTFETAEGYYATLLHEMTHWTSHPSRVNRKTGRWGTPAYAFEELIAEIGSSFLLGMVGISPQVREDHVAYLEGWLRDLKSDPTAIRRALTQAQQAVDYMLNRSKTLRRQAGMEDNDRKARTSVVDSIPLPMLEGYEDAPKIPTNKPITTGPLSDIDIRDRADSLSSGSMTNRLADWKRDPASLRTSGELNKFGGVDFEESVFADMPNFFDRNGNSVTLDGRFSSGGTLQPRSNASRQRDPIKIIDPSVDLKSQLRLKVPPTQEQRVILSAALEAVFGKEKLKVAIDAAAGAGKTTTMKMISMAMRYEFDTAEILAEYASDTAARRDQLTRKAKYLVDRYGDEAKEIAALIPEDSIDLNEDGIVKAIADLAASKGVTPSSRKLMYYTVFGKENKLEANATFPDNTGVGTTTQVAYWALRMGIAQKVAQETEEQKKLNDKFDVYALRALEIPGAEKMTDDERLESSRGAILYKKALEIIDEYPADSDELARLLPEPMPESEQEAGKTYWKFTIGERKTGKFTNNGEQIVVDVAAMNDGLILREIERIGRLKGATPRNLIANGEGMARKVEIGTAFSKRRRGSSQESYRGYDPKTRTHDAVELEPLENGQRPSYRDMGYRVIDNGRALMEHIRPGLTRADGPLGPKVVTETVTTTKNGKTRSKTVVKLPKPIRFTNSKGEIETINEVSEQDFYGYLYGVFNRWALSKDAELTRESFRLTDREVTDRQTQRWAAAESKGKIVVLEQNLEIEDIPQAWVDALSAAARDLLDGNSNIIPTQGQAPKVLLMANPDLTTNPGFVGTGDRDSMDNVLLPRSLGIKTGDVVYVRNGQFTEGEGADKRLLTKEEGEPWRVFSVNQDRAKIGRVYASEDKPLSVFAIDEAQDLNEVWQEIIVRNQDRLSVIAVGDERQQILGFVGSKNIMDAIEPDFMPKLTQSFRFGETLGYLGSLVLARQNLLVEKVTNRGAPLTSEQWKYVVGAAETAAIEHIDRLVDLVDNGDFEAAKEYAGWINATYGQGSSAYDLTAEIVAVEKAKTKKARAAAMDLLRGTTPPKGKDFNNVEKVKKLIIQDLQTSIVDSREEVLRGDVPTMVLTNSKAGVISGVDEWNDMKYSQLVLLGGNIDEEAIRKLMANPELTQAQLEAARDDITPEMRPKIVITQNNHNEMLTFFEHLEYAMLPPDKKAQRNKPQYSTLIGDFWSYPEIKQAVRLQANKVGQSLLRMVESTGDGDGEENGKLSFDFDALRLMLTSLRGGRVKNEDGTYKVIEPSLIPARVVRNLSKQEVTEEALTELTQKFLGPPSNARVGSVVIPASDNTGFDKVIFVPEVTLSNGIATGGGLVNRNDFIITRETIPGQPGKRLRISSKWSRDPQGPELTNVNGPFADWKQSPKFEVIVDVGDVIPDGMTDEDLGFERMARLLALAASGRPDAPKLERPYGRMGRAATGRIIFTGAGLDSGRPLWEPSAELVSTLPDGTEVAPVVKKHAGRLAFDGPYRKDFLDAIRRLGLTNIVTPESNSGVKDSKRSGTRMQDGFVLDATGMTPQDVAATIERINNELILAAKEDVGDVIVQTSVTSKGKESRFLHIIDDFFDPNDDLLEDEAAATGVLPQGYMESMNLHYVVVTRGKRKIFIPGSMWDAHFAKDTRGRYGTDAHIRQAIANPPDPNNPLLPTFDRSADIDTGLDKDGNPLSNIPSLYRTYETEQNRAERAEMRSKGERWQPPDPLKLSDSGLRAAGTRLGVPPVVIEDFIRRRRAVLAEFIDEADIVTEFDDNVTVDDAPLEDGESIASIKASPKTLMSQAVDIMKERVRKKLAGDDDVESIPGEGMDDDDDPELVGEDPDTSSPGINVVDVEDDLIDIGDEDGAFSSGGGSIPQFEDGGEGAGVAGRSSRTRSTPSGRFGRRLTRFENRSGIQQQLSALELAGIRTDARLDPQDRMRATAYAMQFWDNFDQTGIALDMPTDQDIARRQSTIISTLPEVGKRMRARRRADGSSVVQIGKTTGNAGLENPSGETWMLSVDKLLDTIRIPTRWRRQVDQTRGDIVQDTLEDGTQGDTRLAQVGMYWRQSVPLSIANLRELLGLNVVDEKKLREPNAGLSHDTVRYLLAEIGKQPEFSGWRLFAPVSDAEAAERRMTPAERLQENVGRATMRDRFITETFGADAYPYWHDRGSFMGDIAEEEFAGSRKMITSDQYRELEETDSLRRFNAVGKFENSPDYRDDSEAEVELAYEGTAGVTLDEVPVDVAISAPRSKSSRVAKRDLRLELLLDYLGIPNEKGWQEKLKPILQSAFGEDTDVGLGPDAVKSWAKEGVPVAYVQEMIRTGVIPNAKAIWESNKVGQKLDEELVAAKPQVYEALTEFIDRSFPDSAVNTSETRSYIINSREMPTVLRKAAERRGSSFAKGTGDVPRFSRDELQEFVNRFNERFGTNHTIEDIFSNEQLRNAERRLREGQTMFQGSKPGRKGTRKVSPTVANS